MAEQKKPNQNQKQGQQNQNQKKQQNQGQKKIPNPERNNYLIYYHDKEVEVHVNYGNTVLKLTGTIMSNSKYDIILDFYDEKGQKQRLIINKVYLIAVRPL